MVQGRRTDQIGPSSCEDQGDLQSLGLVGSILVVGLEACWGPGHQETCHAYQQMVDRTLEEGQHHRPEVEAFLEGYLVVEASYQQDHRSRVEVQYLVAQWELEACHGDDLP